MTEDVTFGVFRVTMALVLMTLWLLEYLKDWQDATVPDVALVRVVLRITQPPEDLESFTDANPASLWAEHLNRRKRIHTVRHYRFYMNKVRWQRYLTLTMAASREQSGRPGLSIIPAVRYAMLSITKALRAISANFSCRSGTNTHLIHFWSDWEVVIIHKTPIGKKSTIPESYRIHPGFCWTAFWLQHTRRSFLQKTRERQSQTEDILPNPHIWSVNIPGCTGRLPISFFIIPAEELPILNLPEFRMFMATCPTQSKGLVCKPTSPYTHTQSSTPG